MLKLCIHINMTYQVPLGHAKVCLSCDSLYVMHEGLPVMCKGSVCHVP